MKHLVLRNYLQFTLNRKNFVYSGFQAVIRYAYRSRTIEEDATVAKVFVHDVEIVKGVQGLQHTRRNMT